MPSAIWYSVKSPEGPDASVLRRLRRWLRRYAGIRYVLPTAIALGLIAWIATIASAPRSANDLWVVLQQTWVVILVLTFPYLAARALVWYRLLAQLGIHVPWRQAAVSFAGGEVTKSLPAGVYVENYLLSRLVHFSPHSAIRSSMATTAMLGLESLVAVPIALIVGVPGAPWLFWLLLGVVAVWIVVLIVAWLLVHRIVPSSKLLDAPAVQRAADVIEEFLAAGGELLNLQTLVECIPTALYMFVYVVDLFAILRALGVRNVTFVDTMGIYAVIVLAVILVPIPTEIGITELTGLGILVSYHIPESTAALAMLSLRLLATGMTIVVAVGILVLLRRELAAATQKEGVPAG
jgi:uncharacterized membrane protein YbhN (UPF0104 family)